MGLCWCGMSCKIWASGVGSRLVIHVRFHGRSWLWPFGCEIGGGQGVYAQSVDVCPRVTLEGTSIQLGH